MINHRFMTCVLQSGDNQISFRATSATIESRLSCLPAGEGYTIQTGFELGATAKGTGAPGKRAPTGC